MAAALAQTGSRVQAGRLAAKGVALKPRYSAMLDSDPRVAFSTLDTNHNQYLSPDELRNGFGGLAVGSDFNKLWKLADKDDDGKVTFAEFNHLCSLLRVRQETAELHQAITRIT